MDLSLIHNGSYFSKLKLSKTLVQNLCVDYESFRKLMRRKHGIAKIIFMFAPLFFNFAEAIDSLCQLSNRGAERK